MEPISLRPFAKFLRLHKVEEQKHGTMLAFGLQTAQEPDQDDEVCDYESTKPYYKALVERYQKVTSAVEGMETSLYPVREMHQLSAVGAGRSITFDDAAKTISVAVHVVDKQACEKVRKGVYIGFSQGGNYVKTWKREKMTWYTADPGEASLVDSPCLKRAVIDRIAEKSFAFVEQNGSSHLTKFLITKTADDVPLDPTRSDSSSLSSAEIDEYRKLVKDAKAKPPLSLRLLKMAKAKGEGKEQLAERLSKAYRFLSSDSVRKGMWTVQETARIVDSLAWITRACQDEAEYEGDGSAVPDDLRQVLEGLIGAFIDLVDEETKELIAAIEASKGSHNM